MPDWIGGNRYLRQSEMDNNAQIIYNNIPWSINAICATLGNMVSESTINPNIWEGLQPTTDYDSKHGYGLVQWTPVRKLINFCDANGLAWTNGYAQLKMMTNDMETSAQWFKNGYAPNFNLPVNPPITADEYIHSDLSVDTLTRYWAMYYEHPAEKYYRSSINSRISYARYYYNMFVGTDPDPDPDPDPEPPDPDPPEPDPTLPRVIITPRIGRCRAGDIFTFKSTVINSDDKNVAWMVVSGKQYATMTNYGAVSVNKNAKGQVILVKCWMANDPSTYSTAQLIVDGGSRWIYYLPNPNKRR